MPGYFIHLASAPEKLRNSKIGLLGIIAPDLWKKHTPTELEYDKLFSECVIDKPRYEEVLLLCDASHGGTHFGSEPSDTNHANFSAIRKILEDGKLDGNSLFITGYMHHLMVDKLFYSNKSICDIDKFNKDFNEHPDLAKQVLHNDWNKTNLALATLYPDLNSIIKTMPEKVQTVVEFKNGTPTYISLDLLFSFIEEMRKKIVLTDLISF